MKKNAPSFSRLLRHCLLALLLVVAMTAASGGSNQGPLNSDLLVEFWQRAAAWQDSTNPQNTTLVPADLITASGSGLDPDISVAAALYPVSRVARARVLAEEQVRTLVWRQVQWCQFDLLGEPRVNVLELNLALDGVQ